MVHTCLAFLQPVVFCDKTHSAAEDYLVFAPLNSTSPRMFVWWGKWRATHRLAVFSVCQFTSSVVVCAAVGVVSALQNALLHCRQPLPVENPLPRSLLSKGTLLCACNRRCGLKSSRHAETMQDKHGIMSGCAGKVCLIAQKQCQCGFKSALRVFSRFKCIFSQLVIFVISF